MSSANFLAQLQRIIVSKAFVLLFSSLLAVCLSVTYAVSESPQQLFLSITTLGGNMTTQNYFPISDSTIQLNENVRWYVNVHNHMGNVELLSIRLTLLNPDQIMTNNASGILGGSQGPVIFESRQLVASNSTWVVPVDWAITKVKEDGQYLVIEGTKVNGIENANLDVRSLDGKNFRIVLELWRYDADLKDFVSTWSSTQGEKRSSWNQLWFNIANQIQEHNMAEVSPNQELTNSNTNQGESYGNNTVSRTITGASTSESSQNDNNTIGSVTVGGGGGGGGGSGGSGGGSGGTTAPKENKAVLYSLSLNSSEITTGSDISATATTNSTIIKYVKFVWKDPDGLLAANNTKSLIIDSSGSNSSATDSFTAANKTGMWTVGAHFLNIAGNEVIGFIKTFTVVASGGSGGDGGGAENRPPVARDDYTTTPENTAVVIDVLANDTDADDDALTISSFSQPRNGSLTENANGTLTYSPDGNFTGEDTFSYRISDGELQSEDTAVTILVTPVEFVIVDAGQDQNVNEETLVELHGSATGSEGLKFSWSQVISSPEEPVVSLSGADTLSPTFISPSINHTTFPAFPITLIFQLVANDTSGIVGSDTMVVTVNDVNKLPVADAGQDQIVVGMSNVTLSGLDSSDPDGDSLTFNWKRVDDGPAVELNEPNSATPSFIAPKVNVETILTFELTVSDGFGGSSKDSVEIVVKPGVP